MSAPKISMLSPDKLRPWPKNPRKHSDGQLQAIARSLKEFGWTRPIIVDEKHTILAGHGVWEAAKMAGEKAVPVLVKVGLSAAEKRAYVIADNKLAEASAWDLELLAQELGALSLDMREIAGFTEAEIRSLLGADANAGADNVPESIPKRVKAGELWLLGPHRLYCGDCTKAADVATAMGDLHPQLMVTDPPYGVEYEPAWRGRALKDGAKRAEGKVSNDDRADWTPAWRRGKFSPATIPAMGMEPRSPSNAWRARYGTTAAVAMSSTTHLWAAARP